METDIWLKKWVSKSLLDPLIEMNADGLTMQDFEILRRLKSVEDSEYAVDFYDFESYLKKYSNTFICEVNNCQKIYFDQRKQH